MSETWETGPDDDFSWADERRCDWCGLDTDVLIPMVVDYGGTPFRPEVFDEEWCPRCVANQVTEEAAYADPEEA